MATNLKPQLALHLFKDEELVNPKSDRGENYAVFHKYDGWYGYQDFGEAIHSRRLREIPSLRNLSAKMNQRRELVMGNAGRLIFEILIESEQDFTVLNGILNRKAICPDAYIMVHDYIPVDHKGDLNPNVPASIRYELVKKIVKAINLREVRLAPIMLISPNKDEWRAVCERYWEIGGEGVILKRWLAGHSFGKRNADVMKIKEELTLDIVVTDVLPGQGKYEGTLGSLVVTEKSGITHTVSGMTDAQRHDWWNNRNQIIGKIVEVKAMKRLKDGSLREPRFKCIRYDKIEVD